MPPLLRSRYARVALLLVATVAVQLAARAAGMSFLLTQLTMTAYYALVAVGLSLLMGYAGQISLGHAAFFAVGGYASSALTTLDLSAERAAPLVAALAKLHVLVPRQDLYGAEALGMHPWAAFACALGLAVALAVVIGVPVLRLKGFYLAMATLGVGTIVHSVVLASARLGAADGISGVPPLEVLPGLSLCGDADARVGNYYFAWGLVAAVMLLLQNLIRSRVGRALRSIHGAEDAASAMGVDTARYKLGTFVLSAALAAVAGSALAHFNGGIGPSEATAMKSIKYVAIVAVGGMSSIWGTLAAGAVLEFLSLRGYFGSFDDAVFGAILVLVMLFSPDGILKLQLPPALRRLVTRPAPGGQA